MSVVSLEVGERKFKCSESTLTAESEYFAAQYCGTWTIHTQENGTLFIDRDGDMFTHILNYLRSGEYPIFYDVKKGHNHVMYRRLLAEARYFLVDKLIRWLEDKKYLQSVSVKRSFYKHDDIEHPVTLFGPIAVESIPTWTTEKTYVCPRGIRGHKGDRNKCGRQCRNAKGSEDEYVYEDVLKVVMMLSEIEIVVDVNGG